MCKDLKHVVSLTFLFSISRFFYSLSFPRCRSTLASTLVPSVKALVSDSGLPVGEFGSSSFVVSSPFSSDG